METMTVKKTTQKRTALWMLTGLALTGLAFAGGCGKRAAGEPADSPEEAAEYVMGSLQTLDLETFNAYTDNYVCTHHNWIGMPTETEYRTFNELLGGRRKGKRYEASRELNERILEHLSWEITGVREEKDGVFVDLSITNTDMTDVMGEYMIYLTRQMSESDGLGIRELVGEVRDLANGMDALLAIVEEQDPKETCTMEIAVEAWEEDGAWKLHISDAFVNAFMGNLYTEEFSPEVEAGLAEAERAYEEKMDGWAEEFEDRAERFTEGR